MKRLHSIELHDDDKSLLLFFSVVVDWYIVYAPFWSDLLISSGSMQHVCVSCMARMSSLYFCISSAMCICFAFPPSPFNPLQFSEPTFKYWRFLFIKLFCFGGVLHLLQYHSSSLDCSLRYVCWLIPSHLACIHLSHLSQHTP